MGLFDSTSTVDSKARTILGDLPEDASSFEILQTIDQKAGEDVDREDVAQKMRELDDEVDAKLGAVEGDDVDKKEMRDAAATIASRTSLTEAEAMDLLSAVIDEVEAADPADLSDGVDSIVGATDDPVDQNAQPDDGADATDTPDMGDPDNTDPDQKQENEQNEMDPLDLVEQFGDADTRETIEDYAEAVGKDPDEAAADWVAENVSGVTVEGYGDDGDDEAEGGDEQPTPDEPSDPAVDANAGGHDEEEFDQKLNEKVADAVTSDEVLDEMADAVAQKMVDDDEFADSLVETVDQKGDFATTDDTVATAPTGDSQTVDEAQPISGGDN